jgi:hypothetical protein
MSASQFQDCPPNRLLMHVRRQRHQQRGRDEGPCLIMAILATQQCVMQWSHGSSHSYGSHLVQGRMVCYRGVDIPVRLDCWAMGRSHPDGPSKGTEWVKPLGRTHADVWSWKVLRGPLSHDVSLRVMASPAPKGNKTDLARKTRILPKGPVSWVGLEVLITFGSVVGLGPGGCSNGAAS